MNTNKNYTISSLAYIVIIITGLKLGGSIILPFFMAFFLFIIFLPLANKLNSFSIPNVITLLIVFTIMIIIIFLPTIFLISSSNDIIKDIPMYQDKFHKVIPQVITFFEQYNISLEWNTILSLIEPAKIVNYIATFFKGMGNIVVNLLLTLIMVIFLLLEASAISSKILYLTKTDQQREKVELFLKSINRYFIIKTFTSVLTALIVWAMLEYFNLQYAFVFAVLVFLLNYIPSIGSFIAAFPPLLVSILQLSMIETISIAIGYLIINILIGSFLDPKIMGKDLGLSTFIVFISMVIWGWIFGPFGMLLAVPLTIIIKIVCDNSKHYNWVSVILSDKVLENKINKIERD